VKQAKENTSLITLALREMERRLDGFEQQVATSLSQPSPAADLSKKIELEQWVETPTAEPPPAAPPQFPKREIPMPALAATPRRKPPEPSRAESLTDEAEVRFGQKWLLIAGVVVTVLSVGYFLKYSFDQNWVTPAGRVGMAYLTGIAGMGLGEFFRRRKAEMFGLYLVGGGIATFYFSTYAGSEIYDLMPQSLAFLMMAAVTALACALSLVYDTKWLSVLGLVGGFITPLVLSTGKPNQMALMSYMAVLNAGVLSIALFKRWNLLNNLGFFFTWLLFSASMFHYTEERFWLTMFFLNLFFLTYTLVPFGYYFLSRSAGKVREFSITLPNTFIATGYSYALIEHYFSRQAVSVVTLAYAVLFLAMAQELRKRAPEALTPLVMLLCKAALLLIITVPILFSGHFVTVFWAAEAVVLLWAAARLANKWMFAGSLAVLALTLYKFFLYDYSMVFRLEGDPFLYFVGGYSNLLLERQVTTVVTLASVAAFPWMVRRSKLAGEQTAMACTSLYGLFGVLLFIVCNIEVSAFFHQYVPGALAASISVLWAFYSITLMVLGFLKNERILRQVSIGLFALTVMKVFFQDMAYVSTPYRVLSLAVLGILLIGASYLYHRYSARILSLAEKPEVTS
jgi:uncharacterized membrane protein